MSEITKTKKKVLLTNTFAPWGVDDEYTTKELKYEGVHTNFTRMQGIFSPRGFVTNPATHFIAYNIDAPCVVLDSPDIESFKNELRNNYDYLGISFLTCEFPKVKKMIEIAKDISPSTKIILGGYGVTTPGTESLGADLICKNEGVEFFRKLLGEEEKKPYKNPNIVTVPGLTIFGDLPMGSYLRMAYFTTGLGCFFGCDFCATSHFWGKKYIPLLKDGEEIYNSMKSITKQTNSPVIFVCNQDDFLLEKKRNMELWEYAKNEIDKPFHIWSYNSARSVSMYSPEVLLEMGMDTIFIGVETQAVPQSHLGRVYNLRKQIDPSHPEKKVDLKKLFQTLHENGIKTVAASITSTPGHTKETQLKDIDFALSLEPCLSQFSCHTPFPGTKFFEICERENLLLYDYRDKNFDIKNWCRWDGIQLVYKHPAFTPNESIKYPYYAWKKEFELYGPAIFRFIETELNGFLKYKKTKNPLIKSRVEEWKNDILLSRPLIMAGIREGLGLSNLAKKRAKLLLQRISDQFGEPGKFDKEAADALYELGKEAAKKYADGDFSIPVRMFRTEYNTNQKIRKINGEIVIDDTFLYFEKPLNQLALIIKELISLFITKNIMKYLYFVNFSAGITAEGLSATVEIINGKIIISNGLKDGCVIIISGNVRDFISIKNLWDILHCLLWRKIALKFKLINALNLFLNLLRKRSGYGTQN